MTQPNAFHWRVQPTPRRTPSAAKHKRADLKPQASTNFNGPIMTRQESDETNKIRGRL